MTSGYGASENNTPNQCVLVVETYMLTPITFTLHLLTNFSKNFRIHKYI